MGGVWRSNYAEFGLQVPWELYEFPGFRYNPDENFDKFPRGAEVQKYIQRFATERNIYPSCKFNTSVTSMVPNDNGWEVEYMDENSAQKEKFDYVVVCTGMYSLPNLPKYPG